jgi:hypothetical protein
MISDMPDSEGCSECEQLKKESREAYRAWTFYQPMHTDRRPMSRWFKDDKRAKSDLENAYHLAEAKYRLHLGTHAPDSINPRDAVRDLSTVIRGGRLRP